MDDYFLRNHRWKNPRNFAKKISYNYNDESWIFLYSALSDKVNNSFSYIALFPQKEIVCDNFSTAENIIKSSEEKWFGYLSYEVGENFEKLPKSKKSFVTMPKIWLINFAVIFEFDHDKKKLTSFSKDQKIVEEVLKLINGKPLKQRSGAFKIKSFASNFSDQSYLKNIKEIKEMIARGDFYQTNLTRKFFGEFSKKLSSEQNFQLFLDLTELSPANYSSFLKFGENYIISSSPELFLKAKNSKILSRPIKGTAPRSSNFKEDQRNKLLLKNSAKERAENLMIVDLVRNDLSRVCKAGSVEVKKLFTITSYQNIHHMSSEISGKIDQNFSAIDAIKTCFPPGSMTGAPKIKAITTAIKKEKIERGVYSGTIGFFSKDQVNSAVVIRTLITNGAKFEFQVGGAITFDSDPDLELAEIFNKARGIFKLLRLKEKN